MPVNVGQPAPQSGDIKVLYAATGTLTAGAAGGTAVTSFTLPILQDGQSIVSDVQVVRTSGVEDTIFNVSGTSGSASATQPNGYTGTQAAMQSISDIQASRLTAGRANFTNRDRTGIYGEGDSTDLGDLSTAHTIYLNIYRQAASAFSYSWLVYIIGSNVK